MAQTDRQTDKGTWWSVTAYGDEISLLEDTTKYPSIVKKVYGGKEECPTTGRIHFQGAIQCYAQQRMAALKQWLPTAHFEVAKQKEALVKYAMKEDTATGDKLERTNPTKHFTADELLIEIAYTCYEHRETYSADDEGRKKYFNDAICCMLLNDRKLTGQLMNPSLRNFWVMTYPVWLKHAQARIEWEKEALDGGCA